MDTKLYESMYDIVAENMRSKDQEMPFSKEVFLFKTNQEDYEFDVLKAMKFDNQDFLNTIYLCCLYRLPDPIAYKRWESEFYLKSEVFKEKLLYTISNAMEFKIKNIELKNNILNKPKKLINHNPNEQEKYSRRMKIINKLYAVYLKLPLFFQKSIKNSYYSYYKKA